MRWIIGSSLRFRRLVAAVAAGALVFGIVQLDETPVDALPEFTPTRVEVQTEALGLSAAEVEQLITVPMEQDLLNGVAFLERIESASLPGLSSVVLTFEPGTDLLDARQVVQERLTQAHALPNVSRPPQMIQPLSSTSRVSMVRLSSTELSLIEMSVLARWVIGPRLLGVDGVANVSIWGQRERQLQVLVDPERLRDRGVTLSQVIRTVGNALEVSPLSFLEASTPGTGGFIDTANQRLQIFHEQAISSPEELAQVPIEDAQENPRGGLAQRLTVGDVTEVVEDHQPLIGDALCGAELCLLLVIEKFPRSNTLEVTRQVDAALQAMRPGLSGVEFDASIYRPATYLELSIGNLGRGALVAALLLLVFLALFFFDWRTALIPAVVIPLSLIAAGAVLYVSGVTVNTLVVAGLVMALAAVVIDGLLDADGIARRLRRPRSEHGAVPMWRIILEASLEMRSAALYATLVVVVVLLPAFFLEAEAGAFLPPAVLAYALAVSASMVVALTATPALAMLLLPSRGGGSGRESPAVRWIHRAYDRISSRIVSGLRPAAAVLAAALVVVLVGAPFLGVAMRPDLREPAVLIHWEAPPGISLPRMNEVTAIAVERLEALPGVRTVAAHVGRAVMSDQVVGINTGEIWVGIDPSADHTATVGSIESVVDDFPELSNDVLTYTDERITDVLMGTDDEIVVRIYGANPAVLRNKASEVREAVSGVEGVESAEVEFEAEEPTLEVEVDLDRAQAAGVKPGDVRRAAATLLSGVAVGSLFEDQKVFDVVVWGSPDIRQSEADVRNLLIDTPGGEPVRLGDVAGVRATPNESVIRHEAVSRYVDVSVDVAGRNVGATAADVEGRLGRIQFPLEHHAELLGTFAQRQAGRSRALTVALAATAGVFLLLQSAFGSWRLATLAFVTLPAALAGGVAVALLAGRTITIGSALGLVAVLGVAVRGVISLIQGYQRLERQEAESFGKKLVLRATRAQVAPLLLAHGATALVLLPFVIMGGRPGLEIVGPMAAVILGGLLTTSLLQVVVLPAAYLRFCRVAHADVAREELVIALPEVDTIRDPR